MLHFSKSRARSSLDIFKRPMFCYGFQVEQHVSWKRCGKGFEISFLLVCRKYQPNQQQHKPRGIKEKACTMDPCEVVYKCRTDCCDSKSQR